MPFRPLHLGAGSVQAEWPYLGVVVTGPGSEDWGEEAIQRAAEGAWRRAAGRLGERARALAATDCSPARRAGAWNTYVASLLPYPGHVVPIDQQSEAVVMGHFRRAMRLDCARWCPVWMLPGLGILHGARGAPRCPVSTVRAVAAHAWWRGDCWGPGPFRQQQRRCWEEL